MDIVNLTKGANVQLADKIAENSVMTVDLSWDPSKKEGVEFDIDAVAYLLDENGRLTGGSNIVFFGTPGKVHESGSVRLSEDNRTGKGSGPDETITIDFNKVPANISKIAVACSIYQAAERRQNFGQVPSCKVVVNAGNESITYDCTEDFSTETTLIIGEFYRHGGSWKFKAIGEAYTANINEVAASFNE